jgi:hypothetical protein
VLGSSPPQEGGRRRGVFSLPRLSALLHHCVWPVSDHIPQYSYLSETNQGLASLLAILSIDKDI